MTTPRIEEIKEATPKHYAKSPTLPKQIVVTYPDFVKALTQAHQAGKIQALHLLEDLYAKAEDKAELIEMFNEALQDNK